MSIGVIAAHDVTGGGGGGGASAYYTAVLADSPWAFWKQLETSGTTLADASGNSRPMTINNGPPTFAQTGPGASPIADSVSWLNSINQVANTAALSAAGVISLEAWVKLSANPSSLLGVMARSVGLYSSGASDGELTIDSTGKVGFLVFDGATRTLLSPSALSLGSWHHLVATVGPTNGMKIWVDKVNVASNAGVVTAYTGANQSIFLRGGGSRCTSVSAIQIARPAYYTTELSATRVAAHYDAA